VQVVEDVHDTPFRAMVVAPAGLGVLWIVQLVPSQISASVRWVLPTSYDPTAVHAVADVHDTPFRAMVVALAGVGVLWIVQLVPSQISASVSGVLPTTYAPTAVQAVADVHDTPVKPPDVAPVGFGVI
jgi:hypothetical protein